MAGEYPFREGLHFIVRTVTVVVFAVPLEFVRDDPYAEPS
jgi:hypothetical protein